jgi:hypothetical protein
MKLLYALVYACAFLTPITLLMAADKPPAKEAPSTIVVQLTVPKNPQIWLDGKQIKLEDLNKLKPGEYTIDDLRASQGELMFLGLYRVKPPNKTPDMPKADKK